jgi:hypothetical protein
MKKWTDRELDRYPKGKEGDELDLPREKWIRNERVLGRVFEGRRSQ